MSSPSKRAGSGSKGRSSYRQSERWARRVLEALEVPTRDRNDERVIDVSTKRVDTVLDFVHHPVSPFFGRLAGPLRGRLVGMEFCSQGGNRRAWHDASAKADLLFLAEGGRRRTRVAMVHIVVGSSNRFVRLLDECMQPGPWPGASWRQRRLDCVDVWVLDTERLPQGEGATLWRLFTNANILEARVAHLLRDEELPDDKVVEPMVEKLVTALKQEDLQESYDLTVDELLRLGREEGLAKGLAEGLAKGRAEGLAKGRAEGLAKGRAEGLAKGRAEERARRLADLREMARAVLPAEVAKELENIDDPNLLRQELMRRLRRT